MKTSLTLSGLDEPLGRLDITAEDKLTDPMNGTKPESMTLTVEEAARLLRLSRSLAYRLAKAGQLPGVFRLGGVYRISREAFERALAEPDGLWAARMHSQRRHI